MCHPSKKQYHLPPFPFTWTQVLQVFPSVNPPSFPFLAHLSVIMFQISTSRFFPSHLSLLFLSFIQSNRSHGCSDSLSALLPPHPVPEATRYRGQCNPAIRNLLLNPFNLPRLNTKRCPNTSWKKKITVHCATSFAPGGVQRVRMRGKDEWNRVIAVN